VTNDSITPEPDPRPEDATPERPSPPRFDTEPYRVTGPSPLAGTLLLIAVLPVAGLLVGLLGSYISQWFNPVVLFPLAMGALVGGMGWVLVKAGKARGPVVLEVATVLTAGVTILGLHYGQYFRQLNAWEQQFPGILARGVSSPREFGRYIDREAEDGVTIGKPDIGNKVINLGYVGSYIYWIVEAGFVGFMIFVLLRLGAEAPLCELCQRWKKERMLGLLSDRPPDLVSGLLLDGHVLTLLKQARLYGEEGLVLKAAACPACGPEASVDVALEQLTRNAKGQKQTKKLERVRYPGEVLAFLDARSGPA
jgi:hypothetical protein